MVSLSESSPPLVLRPLPNIELSSVPTKRYQVQSYVSIRCVDCTAVNIKIQVFCNVTIQLVSKYLCSRETCCLHLLLWKGGHWLFIYQIIWQQRL